MIDFIPRLKHTESGNFLLIAGPCVVESRELCMEVAEKVFTISSQFKIPFVFKGSYKKANRSRADSFTGIGDKAALEILAEIGKKFDIPVLTDIHSPEEAFFASQYVDVLQIPAFLCRQTDLLLAAAQTGKVINIKKGQFMSPDSMQFAADKVVHAGNARVMLTERGTTFGYQDLVVDFRGIADMQRFGHPVILDITHSLQQPNQGSGVTGGRPDMIETIARAGIAIGTDGIFIETHPEPSQALSDGANMLPLAQMHALMERLVHLRRVINTF